MRTDAHARARITLACLAALAPSAPTVERIAMVKYGIPDIRWLYENDTRFLSQLA